MLQENQKRELVLIEDLGMQYPNENSKEKRRYGLFKCYCGSEFKAQTTTIKTGHTTSCGCYRRQMLKEKQTKHGLRYHSIYKFWKSMIYRCTNPKYKKYKDYGGRGITVCDRWLDVRNFIEDMYPTYEKGLSIDRINNNGNYELSNCRWTTMAVQQINKRVLMSTNKSGYRGVSFDKKFKKFRVRININRKEILLGYFDNAIDGAKVYNKYVIDNNLGYPLNML